MTEFETPTDLAGKVGAEIGESDWITVSQAMIDDFAKLTDDHQWIHVDVERAAKEMPNGKTIAHGNLVLSLMARMRTYTVSQMARAMNYGFNKLRFTAPVPVDSRVRSRATLVSAEPVDSGAWRVLLKIVVEIEGAERPALVLEQVLQYWDPS
jgi:acyl dehydratase